MLIGYFRVYAGAQTKAIQNLVANLNEMTTDRSAKIMASQKKVCCIMQLF